MARLSFDNPISQEEYRAYLQEITDEIFPTFVQAVHLTPEATVQFAADIQREISRAKVTYANGDQAAAMFSGREIRERMKDSVSGDGFPFETVVGKSGVTMARYSIGPMSGDHQSAGMYEQDNGEAGLPISTLAVSLMATAESLQAHIGLQDEMDAKSLQQVPRVPHISSSIAAPFKSKGDIVAYQQAVGRYTQGLASIIPKIEYTNTNGPKSETLMIPVLLALHSPDDFAKFLIQAGSATMQRVMQLTGQRQDIRQIVYGPSDLRNETANNREENVIASYIKTVFS